MGGKLETNVGKDSKAKESIRYRVVASMSPRTLVAVIRLWYLTYNPINPKAVSTRISAHARAAPRPTQCAPQRGARQDLAMRAGAITGTAPTVRRPL